jgi:hypothetical protein
MTYDRFDIVHAWYHYCTMWHRGQASWEYARLSRISQYCSPGMVDLNEPCDENKNAQEIYLSIVLREQGEQAERAERAELRLD